MIVLGIESTAHTFGSSIIIEKDRKIDILSNEKDVYHSQSGIVPSKLMEHHLETFHNVLMNSLRKADLSIEDIDLVAYSIGPGMGHALRIGAAVSRALRIKHNKPVIGVNHCIAHLEVGRVMTKAKDPILLYVSGANTQVIAYSSGRYRIFGETLDMGVGNLIDSVGRLLGIGFPAGPKIENLAKKGKKLIELPYNVKGMDINLGGLYTFIKENINRYKKEDLAYSLQETLFAMLIEVGERAMAHTGKKELLLGGGVACNKRLQEMARIMVKERNAKLFVPPNELLVDNAAMIGITGLLMYKGGVKPLRPQQITILPYQRTEEVEVVWRGR